MNGICRARKLVATAAVVAAVVVPAAPGHAAATAATGDLTFKGDATLERFPCEPPAPFGAGPCNGSFAGEWAGHLAGDVGTDTFDVTWTTVQTAPGDGNGVSATFQYSELVCANLETLAGFAGGTATALAGAGTVRGSYQRPGELFARDVTGVMLASSHFTWVRSVNTAVIVFDTFDLRLNVADLGWVTVVVNKQAGDATFAVAPPGIGVPSCEKPWAPAAAAVAGDIPLTQGPVDPV